MRGTRHLWRELPGDLVVVVRSLLIDLDAVVAEVMEEVEADLAEDGRELDASTEAKLRAGIRIGVERFLAESGAQGAPPDRELFIAHGRTQHDAGRPLEEMLGFYRMAALVLWRRVAAGGFGMKLTADQLAALGSAIFAFIHELSAAGAEGYSQAHADLERTRPARRERLFQLLMAEPRAPRERVEAAAQLAGWRLPDQVAALATRVECCDLVHRAADVLSGHIQETTCTLMRADGGLEWQLSRVLDALPAEASAGLGEVVGWRDARQSFRYAVAALDIAEHRRDGGGRLVRAASVPVWLLLASDRHLAARIRDTHLAPFDALDDRTRERLMATLREWLNSPDQPLAIANRLGVHVQTVRYRMRQMRELLGTTLEDPERRFELAVALRVPPTALTGPNSAR